MTEAIPVRSSEPLVWGTQCHLEEGKQPTWVSVLQCLNEDSLHTTHLHGDPRRPHTGDMIEMEDMLPVRSQDWSILTFQALLFSLRKLGLPIELFFLSPSFLLWGLTVGALPRLEVPLKCHLLRNGSAFISSQNHETQSQKRTVAKSRTIRTITPATDCL